MSLWPAEDYRTVQRHFARSCPARLYPSTGCPIPPPSRARSAGLRLVLGTAEF